MTSKTNRRLALALVALGAATAIACGGSSDTGTVNSGDAGKPAAGDTKAAAPKTAKMGVDTVTLGSGLKVSTGKPAKYTPSGYAAGHQAGNKAIAVQVTIANGTSEPFDLALVHLTAAFGADGTQADRVFDSSKGLTDFEGTLAPGQKRTAKLAFSAATQDTKLIALTVEPNAFENATALFEGSL